MGATWGRFERTDFEAWGRQVDAAALGTAIEDEIELAPLYEGAPPLPAGLGTARPWTVGQAYAGAVDEVDAAIEADREFGLEVAWVVRTPTEDGAALLGGEVPVALEAGPDGLAVLQSLGDAAPRGAVLCDPIGAEIYTEAAVADVGRAVALAVEKAPQLRIMLASGGSYHDAGASAAVELGAAIATAVAYVRAAVREGVALVDVWPRLVLQLVVDADVFVSLAKIRAARWLWRGVARRLGAADDPPVRISARTAWRNRTRHDPWINLLRATVETFAGAVGGADELVVQPFDEVARTSTADARRWALGLQHILRAESHIRTVDDPGSGCGHVESLTRALAGRAWAVVREIEKVGGMRRAAAQGLLDDRIAAAAAARREALARGRDALVGVTIYPDLEEPRLRESTSTSTSTPGLRLAAAFEALRDASDRHLQRVGARPSVLVVTLGPAAEHRARVEFVRSAMMVGGFEPTVVARGQDLPSAELAVLCGSDERIASEGEAVQQALRDTGAKQILVAGSDLKRGTDIVALMTELHAKLGVGR